MVKNGSEILIDALVEQGVDTIFGYRCGPQYLRRTL